MDRGIRCHGVPHLRASMLRTWETYIRLGTKTSVTRHCPTFPTLDRLVERERPKFIKTHANDNTMLQSYVSKQAGKKNGSWQSRIGPNGKTGGGNVWLRNWFYLMTRLHAAELALSRWTLWTRSSKTAHATIDLRSRQRINPRKSPFVSGKVSERRWRPRRYRVDPWSRGREVARVVLCPYPKPEKKKVSFCHRREIDNFGCLCSTHQRPNILYQTTGPRPPRSTGCLLNTATRGWVRVSNECAPFKSHDAVVVFFDWCLSRIRHLAA